MNISEANIINTTFDIPINFHTFVFSPIQAHHHLMMKTVPQLGHLPFWNLIRLLFYQRLLHKLVFFLNSICKIFFLILWPAVKTLLQLLLMIAHILHAILPLNDQKANIFFSNFQIICHFVVFFKLHLMKIGF